MKWAPGQEGKQRFCAGSGYGVLCGCGGCGGWEADYLEVAEMAGEVKECKVCGVEKALSEFGKADGVEGARRDCKACANAASKRSREKKAGGTDDVRKLVLGMVKGNGKVTAVVNGYGQLSEADKALFRVAVGLDK